MCKTIESIPLGLKTKGNRRFVVAVLDQVIVMMKWFAQLPAMDKLYLILTLITFGEIVLVLSLTITYTT